MYRLLRFVEIRIDPAKIWHSEDGWLTDIDCGAAFPAFGGRLGCLCLETGEEYYVADAEILTT